LEAAIDATTGINGLEKLLKLTTTISTTNMHMFTSECKLRKYVSVEQIIDDFYGIRLETYGKRKAYLIGELRKRLVKLSNRARYILATLDGSVDLRRKTSTQVVELLHGMKFDVLDEGTGSGGGGIGDYKYLVKMPMDSVTQENVAHILKEKESAEQELAALLAKSLESMWLDELDILDREYDSYRLHRQQIQSGGGAVKTKAAAGTKTKARKLAVTSTPTPASTTTSNAGTGVKNKVVRIKKAKASA